MSDASEVKIDPAVLHTVADDHDGVADAIEAARAAGPDIAAAVASYGPIMHQFKAAVGDVLAARETALRGHGDEHRAAAETLRREAAKYVAVDEDNADRLRLDR